MEEQNGCHWCGEKLEGLVSEFIHCVRCNERRVIEGLTHTFDPCPVCMILKSEKSSFLSPNYERVGGRVNDRM